MKKVLVLLPKNASEKLIMDGFAHGFELNKCKILKKSAQELSKKDLQEFKPDMIFGYDYSFLIDKNCTEVISEYGCKNLVFYFADEPKSDAKLYKELKKLHSNIFIWDKEFVKEFKNGTYLPLGINPIKYITDFSGYKHTISFVGNPSSESCQKILCELVKVFKTKLNIFSSEENFKKSLDIIKEKSLLNEEELETYSKCRKEIVEDEKSLSEIFCSSKINLNIHSDGLTSMNYRTFEVLTSGGFLLSDDRRDLKENFKISKHLETFKNTEDLIDKINFYLKNLNIAQKIAQLGKFEVIENHTFSARARCILAQVF